MTAGPTTRRPRRPLPTPWNRTWQDWSEPGRPRARLGLRALVFRWPVGLVLIALAALGAATDLTQKASPQSRAGDFRSFYAGEQSGIEGCSGGLRDSITAFQAILTGTSTERGTAESIALSGVDACSPASNGDLFDMATGTPPQSLLHSGVQQANDALYRWAFPLTGRAEAQMAQALRDDGGASSSAVQAALADLRQVRQDGQRVQGMFDAIAGRLHVTVAPISPPLVPTLPRL